MRGPGFTPARVRYPARSWKTQGKQWISCNAMGGESREFVIQGIAVAVTLFALPALGTTVM